MAKKAESSLAPSNSPSQRLSDAEIAVFGSRAHLEKQAHATVSDTQTKTKNHFNRAIFMLCCICAFPGVLQRKWYRNFLMKGFHLVVLLTAGPGIRDTQVCFANISRTINSCGQFCFGIVL